MTGDTQRAAATRGLNRNHAASRSRRMIDPEQHRFHTLIEIRVSGDAHIALRALFFENFPLGTSHALEHWCVSSLILINADTQIHLPRIRILAKQGHDAYDGIRG